MYHLKSSRILLQNPQRSKEDVENVEQIYFESGASPFFVIVYK